MFGSVSLVAGTVAETMLFRKDALAFVASSAAVASHEDKSKTD
jgi:hypothetical protein